jgi:hypothetical protein
MIKARVISTKPSRGTKKVINSTNSRCSLALAKRDSFTKRDDKVKQFHRQLELEHHHCDADRADGVMEEKFLVQGPTQEIVNDLANKLSSASFLLMENDDEMSVVEMAILCDADINTVTKLQDLSRGYLRRKRRIGRSASNKVFPNVAAF